MTPVNSGLIEQSDVIQCDDRLLFDVQSSTYCDITRYNIKHVSGFFFCLLCKYSIIFTYLVYVFVGFDEVYAEFS